MAQFIDEFSFDHPDNEGYGKSRRLRLLSSSDSQYATLETKFYRGWKHPDKKRPKIHTIFKILSPDAAFQPFHCYKALVTSSPALRNRTKNPANEQLLFHGTNRACHLGDDASMIRLCPLSKCSLCSIIRKSFDVGRCGTNKKFRLFGTGIYSSSCSSKADGYSCNGDDSSQFRAMLVTRVIVGNPHIRHRNATNMTEPPCGHHSVIGQPGVHLKYDETVVYDNDAIRPAYLIVYGDMSETTKSRFQALVTALFKTPLAA